METCLTKSVNTYRMIALMTIVKAPKVIMLNGKAIMPRSGLRITDKTDKTNPLKNSAGRPPRIFTPLNNSERINNETELKIIERTADFMGLYANKSAYFVSNRYATIGAMQAIVCPHCKKEIEISQALHDQVLEQVSKAQEEKFKEELEKIKLEEKEKTAKKIREEFELQLKNLKEEATEEKERREKLLHDLLKANEEMRELKRKEEEREIENQKKLQEEREKMKTELTKTVEEKAQLAVAELKKKLEDTQKALEEARQKSQQGSQQLQGEVLELQLEQSLATSFSDDLIEGVAKGVRGADIRQTVRTSRGNVCGVILWELKRTKSWSDEWITKLKQDLRAEKAHVPIIVSEALPEEAKSGFGYKDGVLICSLPLAISIAELVRQQLISIARERFILEHKNNKTEAERLFEYITSHEFLQQLEAIVEVHQEMTMQITKERAAFEKIWKARELQAQKMLKSTTAIAGSLQGVIGNSMPQIKGLDLLEIESGE